MIKGRESDDDITEVVENLTSACPLKPEQAEYRFQLRTRIDNKIHLLVETEVNKAVNEALRKGTVRLGGEVVKIKKFTTSARC